MRKRLLFALSAFLITGLTFGMSYWHSASASVPGTNYLVSQDASGTYANQPSDNPYVSGDGTYIAFDSYASNFLSGDTNNHQDVYVKNTTTAAVVRASLTNTGAQFSNDATIRGFSYDGRYVLFSVPSSGLYGNGELYRRDLTSNTTTAVLVPTAYTYGSQGGAISADGKYVLSSSLPYPGQNWQVMLTNMQTGISKMLSVDSSSNPGNGDSLPGDISCDGGIMTFTTSATNVGSGSGQYIVNIDQGGTPTLTKAALGQNQQVSCNGNIVLYTSVGFPNSTVYEYNRLTGQTTTAVAYGPVSSAGMSDDGRYVSFTYKGSLTTTPSYPSTGAGSYDDVYIRDTKTGTTQLITFTTVGNRSGDAMEGIAISADASKVTYAYQTPSSTDTTHELISGLTTGTASVQTDVYTSLTGY